MFWIFPSHTLFARALPMAHMTAVNSELKRKRILNICFSDFVVLKAMKVCLWVKYISNYMRSFFRLAFVSNSKKRALLEQWISISYPLWWRQVWEENSCFTNKKAKRWESIACRVAKWHTATTFCSQSMRTFAARWADKKSSYVQRRQHERGKIKAERNQSTFKLAKKTLNTYGHSSKSSDRTLDTCEPRFLCIPLHSIHIRAPRFNEAQSGSKTGQKN